MCLNVGFPLQGPMLCEGQAPPWRCIGLLADMDELMRQQRQSRAGLGLKSTSREEDMRANREGVRP
jgi:hypothetical protein